MPQANDRNPSMKVIDTDDISTSSLCWDNILKMADFIHDYLTTKRVETLNPYFTLMSKTLVKLCCCLSCYVFIVERNGRREMSLAPPSFIKEIS